MTYAFSFDARYCSGCKACQAACKDKNNLPVGVLWRRVFEVSGGSWQQNGETWNNTVFAYNLSISCNHCIHPKCAGVCPTNAYVVRDDGIVFLDTTKCVGCGYCAWVCPYSAPQYNKVTGHMTKCDLCVDNLEQGLPPACISACPLRVLDYGEIIPKSSQALWETPPNTHPFPLSSFSHTQPRLAITPHPAMNTSEEKSIGNLEEIRPRVSSNWEELPLMIFTMLTQMAVGGFWAMTGMFTLLWALIQFDSTWLRLLPLALIGAALGVGMLASFTHLGTKKSAWHILNNWRKSSLSKEILFAILFGLGWLCTTLKVLLHRSTYEWTAITAILGIGLIYNMSQVYRFRAAPGWNTWRTNVSFVVSALLLGISVMAPVLAYESKFTGIKVPSTQWITIGASISILLLAQLALITKQSFRNRSTLVRVWLIVLVLVGIATGLFVPAVHFGSISLPIFLIVFGEEAIGRWIFYASRLLDLK
jgi:anaerobic dimethyl sulfoxide reductase subunit B (iron-sulfur subunit)